MRIVELDRHTGDYMVTVMTICTISPLAPLTRPSDVSTLAISITRARMASLSTLWRPPVSYLLSESVERSICVVLPAIASLALMEYWSHCEAKLFNMRLLRESTSTFNLYTCKA